jgi:hypothetical protein
MILTTPYSRKPSHRRILLLMFGIITFQGSYFWIANAAAKNANFILLNYALVGFSLASLIFFTAAKRRF